MVTKLLNTTLVDLLRDRALGSSAGYKFLLDDQTEAHLSYRELDEQARSIAAHLQALHLRGERALLLYPPGLDFIAAFFGCLYAGVIAVPAYPPRRNQNAVRIQSIAQDAQPAAILTVRSLQNAIDLPGCCVVTDAIEQAASEWRSPEIEPDAIAFLQYTSGSTSQPKGVCITHRNLLHNSALIADQFGHSSQSQCVIWLPSYHDMGLIGGILQPLYANFPVTLMSPVAFLQKPVRWLQAISRDRATTSGAPNFAYERCLKIPPEQQSTLDLSSWDVAFVGAEPIRADTLDRFAEMFAECGFRREAFYPCYGLAEATLFVCGGKKSNPPAILTVEKAALQQHQVKLDPFGERIVGCGEVVDQEVAIVDPDTLMPCAGDRIGEIWLAGTSVAQGYWKQPDSAFAAMLDGKRFLRTGDLGFLHNGELFITGRLKDVLIIRGQNYYPQDIEATIARSHLALRPDCGAAFLDSRDRLVVVQEVEREQWRSINASEAIGAIRSAVSQQHQLQVEAILLLKPNSIPKTSSGKIQRFACREGFEQERLEAIARWPQSDPAPQPPIHGGLGGCPDLIGWLREYATHHINSRLIDERRCIPPHIVLDFGNQGLLGMQVPREYGGLGLGHGATMQILQQLGAIDPTLSLFVGLNNILGIRPILNYGSQVLRDELLPILATGRELAAFALTEPGAGSNPQAIASRATSTANGWRLSGTKIWSGSAAWAGVINVFAQHESGINGFAVRRGTKGLRQGAEALTMGMRGMVQNTVYLEDVPIEADHLLGKAGAGMTVAQDAMMYGRLAIAAACVGGMKRCAQMMLRYGDRRTVATGRLLDNPAILSRLSDLTAAITAIETLVTTIAAQLDRGATVPIEAYTACKTAAPEFYWQAADSLVQTLGGRGYIETNLAPQILRDARILRIFEGPTEALNLFLGSRVLHQPQDLQVWLNSLGAGAIAQTLLDAAEQIRDRQSHQDVTAMRWAGLRVGELATFAILEAVLEAASPTETIARSKRWIQMQFEQILSRAIAPAEMLAADALTDSIFAYTAAIGDVEQTAAGEDHKLDILLRRSIDSPAPTEPIAPEIQPIHRPNQSAEAIAAWLVNWLSDKLKIPQWEIDRRRAFADYGIDSVIAVELAHDLENWLDRSTEIEATIAWNFPTIAALADYLAGEAVAESDELDRLSDTEMADLLAAEIAAAQRRTR